MQGARRCRAGQVRIVGIGGGGEGGPKAEAEGEGPVRPSCATCCNSRKQHTGASQPSSAYILPFLRTSEDSRRCRCRSR
eukprot:318306-Chlamydomonas_euryale.AAC.1